MDTKRPGLCFLCSRCHRVRNGGIMSSCSVLQKPELDSLLPFPCHALTMRTFWEKLVIFFLANIIRPSDGPLMALARRWFIFIFNFKCIVGFWRMKWNLTGQQQHCVNLTPPSHHHRHHFVVLDLVGHNCIPFVIVITTTSAKVGHLRYAYLSESSESLKPLSNICQSGD